MDFRVDRRIQLSPPDEVLKVTNDRFPRDVIVARQLGDIRFLRSAAKLVE
jgi:hypothetical protein